MLPISICKYQILKYDPVTTLVFNVMLGFLFWFFFFDLFKYSRTTWVLWCTNPEAQFVFLDDLFLLFRRINILLFYYLWTFTHYCKFIVKKYNKRKVPQRTRKEKLKALKHQSEIHISCHRGKCCIILAI